MITLLLAFFAMLIAVSYVDLNLWEQMKQGLRSEISKEENVRTPLAEVKADLDQLLAVEKSQGLVDITLDRDGIKLFFSSSPFYNSGEANLLPTGAAIIDKVTQPMTALDFYNFNVDVDCLLYTSHAADYLSRLRIGPCRFPPHQQTSLSARCPLSSHLS